MNNIKVSVILPVYNVERYLEICLNTLVMQTLHDIEIICVDDGSTDNSLQILESYAKNDARIKILHQENLYAGVARNNGLKIATGEYVIFLDSDDFFMLDLLEKTYKKAKDTNADIVLFDARCFDTQTEEYIDKSHYFRYDVVSTKTIFSRKDFPDKLFNITTPCPWTKLFRRDFIIKEGLQFQALQNSNDAYFVLMALALADRITYVNEKLVNYRIGQSNNLQSVKTKKPLLFLDAYCGVYESLQKKDIFKEIEKTFTNTVISGCIHNIDTVHSNESREEIYRALVEPRFTKMGILDHPDDYYLDTKKMIRLRGVKYLLDWRDKRCRKMNENFRLVVDRREANEINSVLVSVIVPVYNVADYLEACVNSLCNQTLNQIEIICINDGSTDNSFELLLELAEKDNRIVVCSQKNSGLSATRNIGVRQAKGKYLYFMDSDDILESDALYILAEQAEKNNLDVLYFDATCFTDSVECYDQVETNKEYYIRKHNYNGVYSGERMMSEMLKNEEYRPSACLQLINRLYFVENELWFCEGILHEDNLFTYKCMANAKRVSHTPKAFFQRRYRPNSITTNTVSFSHVYGYWRCYLEMLEFAYSHPFSKEYYPEATEILYRILYNVRSNYSKVKEEEKIVVEILPILERQLFKWCVSDYCNLRMQNQILIANKKNEPISNNKSLLLNNNKMIQLEKRISDLESSTTYKVGRFIMFIPCHIKEWLLKHCKINKK